jgi:hypothetical protein
MATRRKVGRPKGYKLKKFDETRIGFLLKHETPIEYRMLMDVAEFMKLRAPSANLIEAFAYSSSDPLFRKEKFWRALIEYRKCGCRPKMALKTSVSKELYYIHLRLNKYLNKQ